MLAQPMILPPVAEIPTDVLAYNDYFVAQSEDLNGVYNEYLEDWNDLDPYPLRDNYIRLQEKTIAKITIMKLSLMRVGHFKENDMLLKSYKAYLDEMINIMKEDDGAYNLLEVEFQKGFNDSFDNDEALRLEQRNAYERYVNKSQKRMDSSYNKLMNDWERFLNSYGYTNK